MRIFHSIRQMTTRSLLTLLMLIPLSGLAQDPGSGPKCEISPLIFKTLPESTAGPLPVSVIFVLGDVLDVSDKNGQFTLDFELGLSWADSRLIGVAGDSGRCTTVLAEIWHPQAVFINATDHTEVLEGMVEIHPGGKVVFSGRFSEVFTSKFDLHRYPFDQQNIEVHIASYLYGPSEMTFVEGDFDTILLGGVGIPGWSLGKIFFTSNMHPLRTPFGEFASTTISIPLDRLSGHYFWKLLFPLILIITMAWCVFWLDPALLPSQINVATGSVFTLMAFLISTSERLPELPYLSIADKLVVTSTILVFAAFGEAILTGYLAQNDRRDLAKFLDRVGRWFFVVLALALGALAFA